VLSRPRLLRAEGDLGYLLSVMRNTFLNRLRTQSRRVQAAPLSDDAEPAEERGWADPEGAYGARQVYETIAGLPEEFRDVIVAVDLVGLSYKEAAASLGLAEGTVMSRLYRARRQVVRQIDGADED
jgi:RNA polymerase sigma-70 factor (ECF subfamily)